MDKKQVIKAAILKGDNYSSFNPVNTPYKQLNFKNLVSKDKAFSDNGSRKLLYNTTIDNTNEKPGGNDTPMITNGKADADYNSNEDKVNIYDKNGESPAVIKHELLHKKFSQDSGQQDNAGEYTDKRMDDYAQNFNNNWEKEKGAPTSSAKQDTMERIDEMLKNTYNVGDFGRATERNSYMGANQNDFIDKTGLTDDSKKKIIKKSINKVKK